MPMYALRHIAASEMLARGADLAAVAAQLGHKNLTTTGAFYTPMRWPHPSVGRPWHFRVVLILVQSGAG